jgi:CHASE3 domain sensor protein
LSSNCNISHVKSHINEKEGSCFPTVEWLLILLEIFALLVSGYWLYQRSVGKCLVIVYIHSCNEVLIMKEPHSTFQDISVRRRVIISIGILSVLIIVIGLYGLVAIVESNQRLHQSVLEGQTMANAIDTARLAQVHFKKQVQEWKNILLRGNDQDLFNKHLSAFNEEERKVNEYLQSLSHMTSDARMSVPRIADAIKGHKALGHQYREALKKYKNSDFKSAMLVDQCLRGIDRKLTDDIDDIVNIIKDLAGKD